MKRVRIQEAVVVEGKYDKNKISQIVDAFIIITDGFSIHHDSQKRKLIQKLADEIGIIILTDSDGAGFMIRNYIKSFIQHGCVKDAYIPDIYGKEKRKSKPGKEGKIGVEGIDSRLIIQALKDCGATFLDQSFNSVKGNAQEKKLTKTDLYLLGLSGGQESGIKRKKLLRALNLPEHLSANDFVKIMNNLYSYDEAVFLMKQKMQEADDQ